MSIASCGLGKSSLRALFSPREAEELLGISHAHLYRLINAGRFDARKLGGKTVITADSIQRLLETLPQAGSLRRRVDAGGA